MTLQLGRYLLPYTYLLGLLAAVLVAAGSALPWARHWGEGFFGEDIEFIYIYGLNGDGRVTLAMGLLAVVLVLWRLLRPRSSTVVLAATIVVLVVAGLVGVFNWSEIHRVPGVDLGAKYFRSGFDPSWGLMLVTCGGFVGGSALAYQLWKDHYR